MKKKIIFLILPAIFLLTACSASFEYALQRECGFSGIKSAIWISPLSHQESWEYEKVSNNEILITCNNGIKHRTKVE